MAKPRAIEWQAVERRRWDIMMDMFAIHIASDDSEYLTRGQSNLRLWKARCTDQVYALPSVGVEAKRVKDKPARHCTRVIVAGDAASLVREGLLEQRIDDLGGLVRSSCPVLEHRDQQSLFVCHIEGMAVQDDGPSTY